MNHTKSLSSEQPLNAEKFHTLHTKTLKRYICSNYGIDLNSSNQSELQEKLYSARLEALKNISRMAELIELLYSERPAKLSYIKSEIEILLKIKFRARSKTSLNEKIINMINLQPPEKSKHNPSKNPHSIEIKKYYFQIFKYKSFHDSSKLEDLDITYTSLSSSDLQKRYLRSFKNEQR